MNKRNTNAPICTTFELKQFAYEESNPSAFNFSRFIESKSRGEFTVVKREFISEMFCALEEQSKLAKDISDKMRKKWLGYEMGF